MVALAIFLYYIWSFPTATGNQEKLKTFYQEKQAKGGKQVEIRMAGVDTSRLPKKKLNW
jgi:hypothetical protein